MSTSGTPRGLRDNPAVQRAVRDIKSTGSADELIAKWHAGTPDQEFIATLGFDYLLEGGDPAVTNPTQVSRAIMAELESEMQQVH